MSDVDLSLFAMISAELAEGTRAVDAVLDVFGLDEAAWSTLCQEVGAAMAADAGEGGAMTIELSRLFAAHQDRLRARVPLTVEQWAALQADVEAYDDLAVALAPHRLSLADYIRLVRHWAPALANDPDLAARYDAARASIDAADDDLADPDFTGAGER
jgi:hypothetical protein